MLRDHRPLVVTFADKAAVREYVAATVDPSLLPRLHAIVADAAELASLELPEQYVIKPTHGSGAAVVVSSSAPPTARLPAPRDSWTYRHVLPAAVGRADLQAVAGHWLAQLYGQGPNREWVYGRVPRRVIVEEFLHRADGGVPDDYKFFVYHQRCHFIQVDSGRFGLRTQDFFDRDWQHLPLSGGPPWREPAPSRPTTLDEMIDVAECLGRETDFVRVDLYDIDGRVVFGELTSFPAGGDSPFSPACFDEVFGRPWTVPRRYR